MGMPQKTQPNMLNGIDLDQLAPIAPMLAENAERALLSFTTRTRWQGGARTRSEIASVTLGGQPIERRHVIEADEPLEICGTDSAPSPQELILSAIGSCVGTIYVIHATGMGIAIRSLQVEMSGTLDLRGSLELAQVPQGFPEVACRVIVDADATPEQLRALLEKSLATSPNYYHLTSAIPAHAELVIAG